VTNDGGGFTALLGIPQTYNGPATVKIDISAGSQTISRSLSINVGTPAATGLPTWVIIVIVIAIIAAAIFLVWKFYLRKGGKEMIECGECGSLIPGDSKKCPNCGVEFELSKVRCSNCGAYIDQNLDECPECGARFSKRVEQPTVDEADKELRAEYDEFINQIRLQAKAALGDKFTEEKLAEWLKTEPEYLPYDQWVVRKKEREAASTAKPCAQCGTLNPATATVCSKCGSQISGEQKEAPKARTFRRIVRRSDKKEEGEEKPEAKEEEGKK
jgi:RNA polymerase subunit RPABC4/transcription elongation factor Spt4